MTRSLRVSWTQPTVYMADIEIPDDLPAGEITETVATEVEALASIEPIKAEVVSRLGPTDISWKSADGNWFGGRAGRKEQARG